MAPRAACCRHPATEALCSHAGCCTEENRGAILTASLYKCCDHEIHGVKFKARAGILSV